MTTTDTTQTYGTLETHLRSRRDAGQKLLLPYITGGFPAEEWTQLIDGSAHAGADALEIGLPFSDPVMDGPTIQESSTLALSQGATPQSILDQVAMAKPGIPLIAMTYYNICFRMGHRRFANALKTAGVSAAILPDLSLEEMAPWRESAASEKVETVMLAAPTSGDARLQKIVEAASGFVYGVGLVGITGERQELAESALTIAKRLKAITDKPVLIGVGVSNPQQAREVCEVADGVIVGSAVIRRLLDGGSVEKAIDFIGELRNGLDKG